MTQKFSIKGFADDSITGDKIAGFTSATDGFVITKRQTVDQIEHISFSTGEKM